MDSSPDRMNITLSPPPPHSPLSLPKHRRHQPIPLRRRTRRQGQDRRVELLLVLPGEEGSAPTARARGDAVEDRGAAIERQGRRGAARRRQTRPGGGGGGRGGGRRFVVVAGVEDGASVGAARGDGRGADRSREAEAERSARDRQPREGIRVGQGGGTPVDGQHLLLQGLPREEEGYDEGGG